jgi:hypothetical protein
MVADAPCVITEPGLASPWGSVELRAHGKPYGTVSLDGDFEVRANASMATVHAVTTSYDLLGEVAPASLRLRPREPRLVDGWLEIDAAAIDAITGDTVTLAVDLPDELTLDAMPSLAFPCTTITLSPRTIDFDTPKLRDMRLRTGIAIEMRRTAKGARFGTLRLGRSTTSRPSAAEDRYGSELIRDVVVLERKGGWSRIRFGAAAGWSAIEGWVPNRALEDVEGTGWGTIGLGHLANATPRVVCPDPTALYVRDGDTVIQIGTVRPDVPIARPADAGDEVAVPIGGTPDDADRLTPFVRAADLAACTPQDPAAGSP